MKNKWIADMQEEIAIRKAAAKFFGESKNETTSKEIDRPHQR